MFVGIMGSIDDFAEEPMETINYVECHDNRTLWDQFVEYREQRTDSIVFTDSDLLRMHKLGAVIVLTSQGLPFLQIGQEMCRTKGTTFSRSQGDLRQRPWKNLNRLKSSHLVVSKRRRRGK